MNNMTEEVMESVESNTGYPLSPEQSYILNQAGDSALSTSLLLAKVTGELDLARFKNALSCVVQRHSILSSRLIQVPGYLGYRQTDGVSDDVTGIIDQVLDLGSDDQKNTNDKNNNNSDTWEAFVTRAKSAQALGFCSDDFPLFKVMLTGTGKNEHGLALIVCDLLADRIGLQRFWREFVDAYSAGMDLAINEDERSQYAEYAEWCADLESDDSVARGKEYWRQHIAELATEPVLPCRIKSVQGVEGKAQRITVPYSLDECTRDQILRLANATQQPVELLIQALWYWLLAKISGQQRMLLGWSHDCRADYDYFSDAIGVFEKTLPLNLTVASDANFLEWVEQLGNIQKIHRVWQESWSLIQPLTQNHQKVGFSVTEKISSHGNWLVQSVDINNSPFGLSLSVIRESENGEGIIGLEINASSDYFCLQDIEVLSEQYTTLLHRILKNPQIPFCDLSPIGDAELQRLQLLENMQCSFSVDDAFVNVPACIAGWAVNNPDAIAVNDGNCQLSYASLEEKVKLVATCLAETYGIGKDDVVALLLPRTVDLIIALLAVWRLGAAWVPVDNGWPKIRKRQVLEASNAVLIVTNSDYGSEEVGMPDDPPVFVIDHYLAKTGNLESNTDSLNCDRFSINLLICDKDYRQRVAYIIFTSGSTGGPKGVVIEQAQLASYITAASQKLDLGESRQFAMVSTVAADLGHTTLFGALFTGGTLHLATDDEVKDGERFLEFLQTRKIDCLKIVPSHFLALLESVSTVSGQRESIELSSSMRLILGGEAIPLRLLSAVYQIWPTGRVYNHYGPAEATVGVLFHPIAREENQSIIPLSRVFDGSRVYVLDDNLQRTAIGCLGEIYIGGRQLCRGYLNAELGESFIDDPFYPGQRLYCTGDLARYLPDGSIIIVGRRDHQVKIRGFRIELLEVEQVLLGHSDIALAVVSVWTPDTAEDAEQQLVAYVVPAQDAKPDTSTLDGVRDYLAERLPGYMLPTHIFRLHDMPRLRNGKIDRKNLPQPESLLTEETIREPESALETLVMEEIAGLLNQPRISTDKSFFAIGGHSLLVVKLVSRLKKQLHIQMNPGLVFDNPSVIELAKAMHGCLDNQGEPVVNKLERTAQLRLKLKSLSPEEREALLAKGNL